MTDVGGKAIALERRLVGCKNVKTLGVKPRFLDYGADERGWMLAAEVVYYPSSLYADLFSAMGKRTFPSVHTYRFAQDKIKQTALFQMLGVPHPETRVFYGKRQKQEILKHFDFPFVAKVPRGSALGRGVFRIEDEKQLGWYCSITQVAYIQRYLPTDRDVRVVVVGDRVLHGYWRMGRRGDFRTNVAQGAIVLLDSVPEEARRLALDTARACGWDDVGIDLLPCGGRWYVLEANMKYGREGFRRAGIDYTRQMETLIERGEI